MIKKIILLCTTLSYTLNSVGSTELPRDLYKQVLEYIIDALIQDQGTQTITHREIWTLFNKIKKLKMLSTYSNQIVRDHIKKNKTYYLDYLKKKISDPQILHFLHNRTSAQKISFDYDSVTNNLLRDQNIKLMNLEISFLERVQHTICFLSESYWNQQKQHLFTTFYSTYTNDPLLPRSCQKKIRKKGLEDIEMLIKEFKTHARNTIVQSTLAPLIAVGPLAMIAYSSEPTI